MLVHTVTIHYSQEGVDGGDTVVTKVDFTEMIKENGTMQAQVWTTSLPVFLPLSQCQIIFETFFCSSFVGCQIILQNNATRVLGLSEYQTYQSIRLIRVIISQVFNAVFSIYSPIVQVEDIVKNIPKLNEPVQTTVWIYLSKLNRNICRLTQNAFAIRRNATLIRSESNSLISMGFDWIDFEALWKYLQLFDFNEYPTIVRIRVGSIYNC